MRTPIVAGNWKMNKSVDEARALASGVAAATGDLANVEVVVGPVSTVLATVAAELGDSGVGLAAQNMHWADSGAYTGELSAAMLQDVGCQWVILGHSERRQYFGETDESVNRKVHAALAAGLRPIVCIGESLSERKQGWMKNKVAMQVRAALSGVSAEALEQVVIAYEPIWAIGTGETATPEQAQEVHAHIRSLVSDLYDDASADGLRILYGGSVKPKNIAELIAQPDVDGALVGGASLDAESFGAIASACAS
jgi:triosephosphate isomerase